MARWYVDSNAVGLNTGLSKADAAQSIQYLFNTIGIADGDEVWVAHNHNHAYATAANIQINPGAGVSVALYSVNFTGDVYTPGAYETTLNTSYDFVFNPTSDGDIRIVFAGITMESKDDWSINTDSTRVVFVDADPVGGSHFGTNILGQANSKNVIKGSTLRFVNYIISTTGGFWHFDNISAHASHTAVAALIEAYAGSNLIEIHNSDLTGILTSTGAILQDRVYGDNNHIIARGCKLPSSWKLTASGTIPNPNIIADIAHCDIGDGYYYFLYRYGGHGQAELDTAQYLNDTYDGTNGFSAQIDTDDKCDYFDPFIYPIGTIPGQDLTTAKTVDIELSGPSGLLDNDVWPIALIQDTTDQALLKEVSGRPANPLATGSALPSSSAVWNVTTATEYKLSLNLGAQTGISNSNVHVALCVAKKNVAALNAAMPVLRAT